MSGKTWLMIGAIFAGLAVASGAFGAHWLKDAVPKWYPDEALQIKRLADWETAARYQMYHALAIVAVGLAMSGAGGRLWSASAMCFALGIVLFSGSLYVLVFTNIKVLGAITPFGGLFMIAGWVLLAIAAAQKAQ